MPMERTTVFLEEADHDAIRIVRKRWGTKGVSDTIRLALRAYAFGLQTAPLVPTPAEINWIRERRISVEELGRALGIPSDLLRDDKDNR